MTNHTLQKQVFQTGAALAGLSVILGAFGAHSLKELLAAEDLSTFETGVRYQALHAMAILFLAAFQRRIREKILRQAWILFLVGIGVFCGSLYLLATRDLWIGDKLRWIGGLTPVGGISFIAAWFLLIYKGYKPAEGPSRSHRSAEITREKITETE